ncbi:MAG: UDP-3-O-(3-hydroxymyristoyl)glucosamine N-acyltransferase [Fibrobacterota bacterium]
MQLSKIIAAVQGRTEQDIPDRTISAVSSFDMARKDSIIFVSRPKYIPSAEKSAAEAVLTKEAWPVKDKINIFVDDPYYAYAVTALLFEDNAPRFTEGIDQSAHIDPSAQLGEGVEVGPRCILGKNVIIKKHTRLDAGVIIEPDVTIGEESYIHSAATVRYGVHIGNRVIISSGAVIGSEGFANAFHHGSFTRIPCFGTVVIEDDVEIGANTTVDRGNFEDTVIKKGTRIDNLVQIAHNVEIGQSCGIASQVGFAGTTKIGDRVMIGGQAGFAGHIAIGNDVFIGAKAGIPGSIQSGKKVTGIPAMDIRERRRIDAAEKKLPQALRDIKALKEQIESLQGNHQTDETKNNS